MFGEFGAEAEVGDFDRAAAAEEDVVGFDVAVDDVLAVEVDEAFAGLRVGSVLATASVIGGKGRYAYLQADCGDLVFADRGIVINHIGQGSAFHKFHDHP